MPADPTPTELEAQRRRRLEARIAHVEDELGILKKRRGFHLPEVTQGQYFAFAIAAMVIVQATRLLVDLRRGGK